MKKKFLLWATCLLPWLALSQINLGTTVLTNTVVATNLAVPWDMVYGPDGWIWFTELSGKIKRMHPDTYEVQTVFTLPDVALFGFSVGLHSMILHPDFNNNHYLYVHYAYTNTTSKIVRYEYDSVNNTLANATLIMGSIPAGVSHNGSRMVIVGDKLYICLGDTYSTPAVAQNLSSINGKVLRMNLDGSIPDDNPTAGSYVYSFGHRNPQGLCYANGKFYSSEHGTTANDEINIIEPNRNYGWPTVEGVCNTTAEIAFCNANNVAEPIWSWSPSIAPAGIDYYHNSAIPEWDHSLLLVVLKNKELIRLKLNEDGTQVTQQNIYLVNTYGRLRDLLVLPDGRVFICTSNKDYAGTPGATDDRIIEIKNPAAMSTHVPDADLTKIYPIPAQGVLNIDSSVKINSVMVTDNVGKVIYVETFTPQINTSSWATGMYFIQFLDASKKVIDRKKVLIE